MQEARISLLFKGGYYKIESDTGSRSGVAEDKDAGDGEQMMHSILAGAAEQLLEQRFGAENADRWKWLVKDIQKCSQETTELCENTAELLDVIRFSYEKNEDLLGSLYLSLRKRKERKQSGSYYTPGRVAKRLAGLVFPKGTCSEPLTILDPACGTGSILLALPEGCELEQIYGYDIDPMAIAIVRVNMALRYGICDKGILSGHFMVRDFLKEGCSKEADLIVGNPPWGSEFTPEEEAEYRKKFRTAATKQIESGNLFVEQSLMQLKDGGRLCFVLPEALLHVKTHRAVRALILKQSFVKQAEYLGEVFKKVQCPSVILLLEKQESAEQKNTDNTGNRGTEVRTGNIGITDNAESTDNIGNTENKEKTGLVRLSPERFLLDVSDEEFALLQKLDTADNIVRLRGKAAFALGIVTGNNEKYLQKTKTTGNEPILKGKDIERFCVKEASAYIAFAPENYQQVAPVELYRAPEKLLYRFVGVRPVFAYDDKKTLTLNSCNLVIPAVKGMDMRYIMAVFNSGVIEFWHRRVNHSMKLLRAHIEEFPIPVADAVQQQKILQLAGLIADNERERHRLWRRLDAQNHAGEQREEQNDVQLVLNELCVTNEKLVRRLNRNIAELFGLTDAEYEIVCAACGY